mmetsp:Transcript_142885/g.249239  ORF Transcript_142885/g.249239 Transcript_142885/m.249239 type:complete len:82 (+) Transcript_142885:1766-2011(+)
MLTPTDWVMGRGPAWAWAGAVSYPLYHTPPFPGLMSWTKAIHGAAQFVIAYGSPVPDAERHTFWSPGHSGTASVATRSARV